MKAPPNGFLPNPAEGERKAINSELWHACAGPLVSLPPVGSLVVYFPQGHSEQVAASMQKETEFIPSYPILPSKMVCILHGVTLHADSETDEVYAQMTLQPVSKLEKEAVLASEIGMKQSRQPAEFFCKTLTASDTSTHGGFSVPRRAAEKIFPPLDFSMQPPAQEIVARDLHDNSWTFRHIYRGQPKRHLLTTGWSVFVSTKRLFAGDSVLFIRDDKSQLLLGVRRSNRQQPALSSSVISSDSMHIGILAAAAHAAASNSPFVIFFNPRASPAEFVIPFSKYNKAMYTQVSLGMRFRMMFETEESGVRRYMGTITGISDLDPVRWKNSQWRNLQVGWDESAAGDRPSRVSLWDIEPVVTPFYICPPPFFRPKLMKQPGVPDEDPDIENVFKRAMPWLGDEFASRDASLFPGMSLVQWMNMQQNNQFPPNQPNFLQSLVSPGSINTDDPAKLLNFQAPNLPVQSLHVHKGNPQIQPSQMNHAPPYPQQQMPNQHLSPYSQHQRLNQPALQNDQSPIQQRTPPSHLQQIPQPLHVPYQQPVHIPQSHQLQHQHHQQQQLLVSSALPLDTPYSQQHLQPQMQQTPPNSASVSQPVLSDQQLQLLQKLQQQQQQLNSGALLRPQQQLVQNGLAQPHPFVHQSQVVQKPLASVKALSALTEGDAPSCSTSPSTNNCQISPSTFVNKTHQMPTIMIGDMIVDPVSTAKPDIRIKHEVPISKPTEMTKFKSAIPDPLEASSSGTSYCLDAGTFQHGYALPVDGDVQSQPRSNLVYGSNMDGLPPDALLSRGYETQKDLQNLLFNYGEAPRDIETELSTAALSTQSFGVRNVPFKPNDVAVNEAGVFGGMWGANQTQRMRTYTKVQKRGSVGRSIDVTRYKGYEELRRDLARMFGMEGQMEDPQSSEWKLVYVDHENDILLVGDDPWEEFVSCVQSIKILSASEVQQMSLDGNLANVGVPNQACSATDSGNAWRPHYDDHSAASFNR